jgi:hypothetical protein
MELFGSAWWADGRTAGDVRRMLAASDLVFAVVVCQPELVAFYRRWGFTERVGRSRLLRRTADPLLR